MERANRHLQTGAAAVLLWCACVLPRVSSFHIPPALGAPRTGLPARALTSRQSGAHCLQLAATARSRRDALMQASTAAALLLSTPAGATDFQKAVDIFGSDGDEAGSLMQQAFATIGKTLDKNFIDKRRPAPVRLPRTELYLPFAVLLMRSCYDAVDDLNFVPMDQFQIDFFLLRQNEWEKYLDENDCKQGYLSDPMYFDFISAAQFATITQQMEEGKLIFEERTGAEGTVNMVARDAKLQDNQLLPAAFFKVAGDKMYAGLMANFTGANFFTQPPSPLGADATDTQVIASLTLLYKKMVELGYALDVTVSGADELLPPDAFFQEAGRLEAFTHSFAAAGAAPARKQGAGRRVSFTLKAPATLWGRQWLGLQQYLHTDHDLMIAMAYLRECGRAATVHSKVDANSFTRQFVLL